MHDDPIDIVLVEDDPDHAELVLGALADNDWHGGVVHLADGAAALAYLTAAQPQEALLLLDLRLPKIDGLEVLREARARSELRDLRIVVPTTSAADGDISAARAYGADSYLVKPSTHTAWREMLQRLRACVLEEAVFWPA